ncbi:MAG: hypothetical protein P1U85_13805 [Verrucomicrobiales bacterium]|nr:hypothetical protein [Verrucomicrobiales bacterium]
MASIIWGAGIRCHYTRIGKLEWGALAAVVGSTGTVALPLN